MRKHHIFRPRVSDRLEPRTVPSTTGVVTPTGIPGISVILPTQVLANSPQVKAAFEAFDASYYEAVDVILLAPNSSGVIVPSANRAAFDAAIEKSLEALANHLVEAINTPSTIEFGSGSSISTTETEVFSAIVGPGSTSLESQLSALPTTAINMSTPIGLTTAISSTSPSPVPLTVTTAEQVRPTLRPPVAEDLIGLSPSTTSTTSSSPTTKAAEDVRSAFGNFLNDYFKAVQGVLLTPGEGGQVNPQANRTQFDARVNQALQSLETRLMTSLSRYPATSALGPQLQSAIEGNGANSLKSQLANLATPNGSQAAIVRNFTLGSAKAVAQALSIISADVSKLLNPAGTN